MIRAATLTPILGAILGCFATQANATYWYYGVQDTRPLKFYEAATQYCEAYAARSTSLHSADGWLYTLLGVDIPDPESYGLCLIRWSTPSIPEGASLQAEVSIVDCKDPHSFPHDEGVNRLASCSCNVGYKASPYDKGVCIGVEDSQPEPSDDQPCKAGLVAGNPIRPATAEKYRSENDFIDQGPAPLSFTRIYRSTWGMDASRPIGALGRAWTHSHDISLQVTGTSVLVTSAEGYVRTFAQLAGTPNWTATNSADILVAAAGGGWIYHRADDDSTLNFDAAGKPTSAVARNGGVTTYLHNATGQLASITGFSTASDTAGFAYDANGNRTGSNRTVNGQTTSRSYGVGNASNQLTGFTQTQGGATTSVAFSYNANGDLINDGLRSYSYNAEGRLSDVTTGATDTSPTTRYAHNALGQRVFKTEPLYPPSQGSASESDAGFMQGLISFFTQMWTPRTNDAEKLGWVYTYDEDGNLISETGTGGANSTGTTDYIYLPTANGAMPIAAVINGSIYAISSDHLNTPRRLIDQSGQVVWQWAYSACGDTKPTTAHNRFANLDVTPNAGTTGISDIVMNLRWPGQYHDQESGLNYNWKRYYDPKTGRYPQPDPIGLDGGPNKFAYANLNPLMFMDPNGLMGVGSGVYGVPGSGASVAGVNGMVGGGFSVHLPLGIGIGIDGGMARDTSGNACIYSNVCYTVGPGMSGAIGLVGSTGSGLLASGTTDYQGTCWTGGAGLTGSGSILFGKDGSMSLGRGLAGPGAGASATYQACRLQLLCSKN